MEMYENTSTKHILNMTEWMVLLCIHQTQIRRLQICTTQVQYSKHYDSLVASKIIAQNLYIVDAETIDKKSSVSPL